MTISRLPRTSHSMFTPCSNVCRDADGNDCSMKAAASAYARGLVTLRSPIAPASVSTISRIRHPSPRVRGEGARRADEGCPSPGAARHPLPAARGEGSRSRSFPATFDLALAPAGLVGEAGALADRAQSAIALDDVEPNTPLQLTEIDGTEMHRTRVRFGEMIRSVEYTSEVDAMLDAEHVRSLVRDHFAASACDPFVSGERIHADAIAQRRLSENEIPRWIGIEIDHGDSEHAVGVRRELPFEIREDVGRQKLTLPRIRIRTRCDFRRRQIERRTHDHRHHEKCFRKFFQCLDRRRADSQPAREPAKSWLYVESTERLEIDGVLLRSRAIRMRAYEIVERLTALGM